VGRTVFDFFPREIAQRFDEDDKTVINTGTALHNREEPYEGPSGETRWLSTTKVPLMDASGQVIGLVGISRDITDRKRAQEELALINHELQRLVKQDPLTGICNRRSILENAGIEWLRFQRYGEIFSVLMLDADNFKKINDTYGHLVGDEVLKHLTGKLKLSLRDVDQIGRYGGEEFLVLLPHTDAKGAKITADRVLQSLRSSLHTSNGGSLNVTMSIGGATATKNDADVNALINRADAQMYKAKQQGKNCFMADQ
jgi:diguanylate cyclase